MKFGLVLLRTQIINFHLTQAFGCIVILHHDGVTTEVLSSMQLAQSKRHGLKQDALVEAYNSAVEMLTKGGVGLDAIQRFVWNDTTMQYDSF